MSSNKSESVKNGWFKLRFEQIAENIVDHVEIPSESGYERFVGGDHLDSECLRIKRWGSTNDVDAQKLLFKKGHILFGKRNAYLRKVAYADFDGVCSAHMLVLKSKPEFIEEKFFPFFMQTDQFWERADMISEGSMSPTIKWKTLAKQEFMIPSKEEQRRVGDILWAAEDYIVKSEKLADETELYKKILMKELLTKGIGHKQFKDSKKVRIPDGWDVLLLKDCVVERKERSMRPHEKDKYIGLEHFDTGSYTLNGYSNSYEAISNCSIFQKGDLLYGKLRPYLDKASLAGHDGVCSTEILVLNATEVTSNKYLLYHFHSDNFVQYNSHNSYGTKMPRTSMEILGNYEIPLPPLQEQHQIVEILSKLDATIQNNHRNIDKTKELKKMLINQLLNGGLETVVSINSQAKQLYKTQVSE